MMTYEEAEIVRRAMDTVSTIDRALRRLADLEETDKPWRSPYIGRGISEEFEPRLSEEAAAKIRGILRVEYLNSRETAVGELARFGVEAPKPLHP